MNETTLSARQRWHTAVGAIAVLLIGVTYLDAAAADCDRACLMTLADDYLAAVVDGEPGRVPLASDVVFVENLERMQPGEGAWRSVSGPTGDFRIVVPDEHAQQVGALYALETGGEPAQLFGFRLKLDGGQITEAEHIVVSSLQEAAVDNVRRARSAFSATVPEAYRDSRARLVHIGLSYYDALDENNGALAPFADRCVRMENGLQTARNAVPWDAEDGVRLFGAMGCERQLDTGLFGYITSIDNRRVPIADEQTGLVFGLSHFRHAMDSPTVPIFGVPGVTEREFDFEPFDLPAIHIYKIWDGRIYEIEAIGVMLPHDSPTGWE